MDRRKVHQSKRATHVNKKMKRVQVVTPGKKLRSQSATNMSKSPKRAIPSSKRTRSYGPIFSQLKKSTNQETPRRHANGSDLQSIDSPAKGTPRGTEHLYGPMAALSARHKKEIKTMTPKSTPKVGNKSKQIKRSSLFAQPFSDEVLAKSTRGLDRINSAVSSPKVQSAVKSSGGGLKAPIGPSRVSTVPVTNFGPTVPSVMRTNSAQLSKSHKVPAIYKASSHERPRSKAIDRSNEGRAMLERRTVVEACVAIEEQPKRGRGRPRGSSAVPSTTKVEEAPSRRVTRSQTAALRAATAQKQEPIALPTAKAPARRGRGRPRSAAEPEARERPKSPAKRGRGGSKTTTESLVPTVPAKRGRGQSKTTAASLVPTVPKSPAKRDRVRTRSTAEPKASAVPKSPAKKGKGRAKSAAERLAPIPLKPSAKGGRSRSHVKPDGHVFEPTKVSTKRTTPSLSYNVRPSISASGGSITEICFVAALPSAVTSTVKTCKKSFKTSTLPQNSAVAKEKKSKKTSK